MKNRRSNLTSSEYSYNYLPTAISTVQQHDHSRQRRPWTDGLRAASRRLSVTGSSAIRVFSTTPAKQGADDRQAANNIYNHQQLPKPTTYQRPGTTVVWIRIYVLFRTPLSIPPGHRYITIAPGDLHLDNSTELGGQSLGSVYPSHICTNARGILHLL